jgi:hypothetical protein
MASQTALDLFRNGADTVQIALYFRITEARALEQLSRERSAALGIPDPYKSHSPGQVAWPSGRVAYAGHS